MDRASASLNEILNSGNYVREEAIPLFDEHDEHDAQGNVVRRFDRQKLEDICRECNRRAEETGDLSPFGPGHTIPGAPETMQPPIWGFYAKFRVGTYGPSQKLCILADRYVKKLVDVPLANGDVVKRDGPQEVATYPRRSVELWLRDGFIDWVGQLRRTPQRDLGLDVLSYSRESYSLAPIKQTIYGSRRRQLAAIEHHGKLFYSFEANMADNPTAAPDANEPDADFRDKVMRCVKGAYPSLDRMHGDAAARYAADDAAAAPAGDNTFVPGQVDERKDEPQRNLAGGNQEAQRAAIFGQATSEGKRYKDKDGNSFYKEGALDKNARAGDPERMAKDETAIRYARLEAEVAQLRKERDDEKERASLADAERRVAQLQGEGFAIDRTKEVLRFSKLDAVGRDERETDIRANYRREAYGSAPPTPLDFSAPRLPARPGSADEPVRYSKEQVEKAVKLASEKGIEYADALKQVAAK